MISVVLATKNGARTLPRTLSAFCALEAPGFGWELILVDNGSTDQTQAIAWSFREKLPIHVLVEPAPGRTAALLAGASRAGGEWLLFTDDDVLPAAGWLRAFESAVARYPGAGFFGGQIRHHWEAPPPDWLRHLGEAGRSFGGTKLGKPEGPMAGHELKGANFLCRRDLFIEFSMRRDLGWGAGGYQIPGEETDLARRLLTAGHGGFFLPDACLEHIVRVEEMTLRTVLTRYFRIGRGMYATGQVTVPDRCRTWFGAPRFMYRRALQLAGTILFQIVRRDGFVLHHKLIDLAMLAGQAEEYRVRNRMGRSRDTSPG